MTTDDARYRALMKQALVEAKRLWPTRSTPTEASAFAGFLAGADWSARTAAPARTLPDRDTIERALSEVLWNASNYPNPSAVLGRSIEPLRTKAVNAVMAALADQSTTASETDDARLAEGEGGAA